jgi:hypothetical protein
MLYGNESGDFEPDEGTDQFISGLSGRLSLPLSANLALQMDGEFEYSTTALWEGSQDDLFTRSHLLGGHLSWRDPNVGLIGGFAAFGGALHDEDEVQADYVAAGGEAQFYVDAATFYVQGGYLDGGQDDDYLNDAFFGRGVVRYFVTPNSRLQAQVAYAEGDVDDDDIGNLRIVEWGVRYDTMIPGVPILGDANVFVAYRGADFEKDGDDPGGFTDHTIMGGFVHRFGGATARQQDLVGVTLDFLNFGRWVSAGEAVE